VECPLHRHVVFSFSSCIHQVSLERKDLKKIKIYFYFIISAGALCRLMPLEQGSHEIRVSQIRLKWVLVL
jgi:hypothetical protein